MNDTETSKNTSKNNDTAAKAPRMAPEAARAAILLRDAEEFFVLLSAYTREPYVNCDPETFDDQILLYFDQEEAKQEATRMKEEQSPVSVARLEKRQFMAFYTSLYTLGVNAILIHQGGKTTRLQLSDFVKRKEPEDSQAAKQWVENPALHVTALYLMQELRRRPGQEIPPDLREMQEEIAAHFKTGRFILAAAQGENKVPLVRLGDNSVFQPIFTDILEFAKFNRENKLRPLVVSAADLPKVTAKEANGVIINPMGVNLPLTVTAAGKESGGSPLPQ